MRLIVAEKSKYEWVMELNFTDHFSVEYLDMIEIVGIEKFLLILQTFGKSNVYFSLASIGTLQKEYVEKNKQIRTPELARKLGISEWTVQKFKKDGTDTNAMDLFEEREF